MVHLIHGYDITIIQVWHLGKRRGVFSWVWLTHAWVVLCPSERMLASIHTCVARSGKWSHPSLVFWSPWVGTRGGEHGERLNTGELGVGTGHLADVAIPHQVLCPEGASHNGLIPCSSCIDLNTELHPANSRELSRNGAFMHRPHSVFARACNSNSEKGRIELAVDVFFAWSCSFSFS